MHGPTFCHTFSTLFHESREGGPGLFWVQIWPFQTLQDHVPDMPKGMSGHLKLSQRPNANSESEEPLAARYLRCHFSMLLTMVCVPSCHSCMKPQNQCRSKILASTCLPKLSQHRFLLQKKQKAAFICIYYKAVASAPFWGTILGIPHLIWWPPCSLNQR